MKISYKAFNNIDAKIAQAKAIVEICLEHDEVPENIGNALWAAADLLSQANKELNGGK